VGNLLTAGSGLMVYQGFSQDYETEADDTGWNFLLAANLDPHGMIGAFQKLQDWERKQHSAGLVPQAFQSHPATEKRIKRLEEKWKSLPRKSGFQELPPFQWTAPSQTP
jgi:predicted Zn-dependent protease